MPRYHLFAGEWYYPSGGLGDYQGSFDSVEDAIGAANAARVTWNGGSSPTHGWACVATEQGGALVEVAKATDWTKGEPCVLVWSNESS